MTARPPLTWVARPEPLPAAAVTARPDDVPALVAATAERLRAGAVLRVAAGDGCVVLGAVDDLPWFPGAVYLGRESGLLVPTTSAPSPPADVVLPVLRARVPAECDLLVLVPWGVLATRTPARPAAADDVTALVPAGGHGG